MCSTRLLSLNSFLLAGAMVYIAFLVRSALRLWFPLGVLMEEPRDTKQPALWPLWPHEAIIDFSFDLVIVDATRASGTTVVPLGSTTLDPSSPPVDAGRSSSSSSSFYHHTFYIGPNSSGMTYPAWAALCGASPGADISLRARGTLSSASPFGFPSSSVPPSPSPPRPQQPPRHPTALQIRASQTQIGKMVMTRERRVAREFLLPRGPLQAQMCGTESGGGGKRAGHVKGGSTQGGEGKDASGDQEDELMAHWNPTARLFIVRDWTVFPLHRVPPLLVGHLEASRREGRDGGGGGGGAGALPLESSVLHSLGAEEELRWLANRKHDKEDNTLLPPLPPRGSLGYLPIIFFSPFETSSTEMIPLIHTSCRTVLDERHPQQQQQHNINDNNYNDDDLLPLTIEVDFSSLGWWQVARTFDMGLSTLQDQGFSDRDLDEVRQLVGGTPPLVLLAVLCITTLHLSFDLLAFRSELSFWQSLRSGKGISFNSLLLQLLISAIVFLYLLNEETTVLVLFPAGGDILLCGFKVWRLRGQLSEIEEERGEEEECEEECEEEYEEEPGQGTQRKKERKDKTRSKEKEREMLALTRKCDALAFHYLGTALIPPLLGYAFFSLSCQPHESWYTFLLGLSTSTAYGIGFILMTPQLFINHKLQSVAHINFTFLAYRFFNTFIDDVFAMLITMPGMHRLAVFRDDLVFLVYLWQLYRFPSDSSRASHQ